MSASRNREETIFDAVIQLPTPEQRAAYLNEACAGQPELRRQVEELLAAHEESGTFLDQPAAATLGVPPSAGSAGQPAKAETPIATVKLTLPAEEQLGTMIGRYKLLEKVGEGGFGVVYVAEQREPVKRRVALKVIKLGMDTKQVVARFEAERQALALMDHPNIAKVLDAGATNTGRPYFVMELVRGIKITDYCDQNNLSTRERLDLFMKVCQAIQHAHQKGIIHRDIKPSNILVTVNDGVPVPKVIDFGIAKATQGELTDKTVYTQLQQFIGTPAYMSPEQAEMTSLDIDTRSDIYALGVLLYELLTGRTPFDQKELLEAGLDGMRRMIREQEPQRPSTRVSSLEGEDRTATAKRHGLDAPKLIHLLRGDLDWIVMKCLEKDRTRRYETANGVAMDLQRHLSNEPVSARPPSTVYRLQKFARRNKLAFAAVSAVAIALCLGVIASTWQAVRATREQRIADRERGRAETEAKRADANAAAEARQRQKAEQAVERASQALSKAIESEGDRLAREGGSGKALAHFARALRLDPDNRVAAQRILSLLNQRDFPLPLTGPPATAAFDPLGVLAYSADQRRFCIQTNQNSIVVLQSDDRRPLGKPLQFDEPLQWVRLNRDGTRLALGFAHRAAFWDCETGVQLAEVKGEIEARSQDGRLVLVNNRVVEVDSGRELCSVADNGKRWSAVFSPDASKLAFITAASLQTPTGDRLDRDAAVTLVLATDSGKRLMEIPTQFTGAQPYLRFVPDGRRLIIAGFTGGSLAVWDLVSRRESLHSFRHPSTIRDLDMSRDGRVLAGGSRSGEVFSWNLLTSAAFREPCPGIREIERIRCTPDGSWLTTSQSPASPREPSARKWWDTRAGRALPVALYHPNALGPAFTKAYGYSPDTATYNHDGSLVATTCRDGAARIWRTEDGALLFPPFTHGGGVALSVFSPDSTVLATGAASGEVCLLDAKSGKLLKTLGSHKTFLTALVFSPDGRRLASASDDGGISVWETGSGKLTATSEGKWGATYSLVIDPSGQKLAAGYNNNRAEILDLFTLRVVAALTESQGSAYHVQFSHDGKWLCTSSTADAALLWNALTGEGPLARFPHGSGVWAANFSSDDQSVVTASYDSTARVWDRASGRPLTEPLPLPGVTTKARFSPNGRSVVTSSGDGTAVVWDVRTGRALSEPFRQEAGLQLARFSPDGKHILLAGRDGLATVHDWIEVEGQPPVWLPELAEAVGGYRLTENGVAEFLDDAAQILERLRQTLTRAAASDSLVKWGQWYLADRWTRTISPHSRIAVRDYAETLAQRDELPVLETALNLGSRNPRIYQKLAELIETALPETGAFYERLAVTMGAAPRSPARLVATVPPGAAPPASPVGVLDVDPLDLAALLKHEGQAVRVKGKIVQYTSGPSGNHHFLNFSKNFQSALSLVFTQKENPAEVRPELLRPYVNQIVVVEGTITLYEGRPNFQLKSLAQIKILEGEQPLSATTAVLPAVPTSQEIPPPPTNTVPLLDPRQGEELLKREGDIIKVKGVITRFASAPSGRVHYLNFGDNYQSSLALVCFPAANPAEFRPELLRNYVNKTVIVEGRLETYKGGPQIQLKSLAEIKVVEATVPSQ